METRPLQDVVEPSGFTGEQEARVREIFREEIRTLDVDGLKQQQRRAIEAAERVATLADQMQRIFASDQISRAHLERAITETQADLAAMRRQMVDNTKDREQMHERLQALMTAQSDLAYRIGDAFVPILGRNPMVADGSTLVLTPLRVRVDEIDTSVRTLRQIVESSDAHLQKLQARAQAREDFINKALPVIVSRVINSPLAIKLISWILAALAAALFGAEIIKLGG